MKKDYSKYFIPKSAPIQPINYRVIGLSYDAVFSVVTDNTHYKIANNDAAIFYIELSSVPSYKESWNEVDVLVQCDDCRKVIYHAQSVKDAINYLTELINKLSIRMLSLERSE